MAKQTKASTANLGFEDKLWAAADKLRGNMDAAEYKHVVLGLIFLKYISDAFMEKFTALQGDKHADPEDKDEYLADNIFWVPPEGRWSYLQNNAKRPEIGTLVDDALAAIERDNKVLKGVLPRDYARPALDKARLGEIIDLIATIGLGDKQARERDVLGRVYEYFLGKFAAAEGKLGGQFYTPQCVVKLLVEMLEPYKGRVLDPCCGSGGMFVQAAKFVQSHASSNGNGKKAKVSPAVRRDISIYGQESNNTTWRLALMNLAIRGIDGKIEWGDSFLNDKHKDLKADYILANPPFNMSDWSNGSLTDDVRWKYGSPPASNANYAWIQHFVHHLAPPSSGGGGTAGFVMANASLASEPGIEADIRRGLIEEDLVECIVSLPDRLFYTTPIPACLWFISRGKSRRQGGRLKRRVLFIDASGLGVMPTRTSRELEDDEIEKIAGVYRAWKNGDGYVDEAGFCKCASVDDIAAKDYSLHPAAYIEVASPSDQATHEELRIGLRTLCDSHTNIVAEIKTASSTQHDLIGTNLLGDGALDGIAWQEFSIGDVVDRSNERLGKRPEPEILTCTEQAGLILQRERFSKRVATENVTKYKYVRRNDIVYNPYLLWAGSIDQCWIVEHGITSPAYEVFRVRDGFDPYVIGYALTTRAMIARYSGISVGTVTRRRRAAPERFLELKVALPSAKDQTRLRPILQQAARLRVLGRELERNAAAVISHAARLMLPSAAGEAGS